MVLSKSCAYAIRAMVCLDTLSNEDFVSIQSLSEQLGVSFYFLTKILQRLSAEGMLESYRGPKGGVKLLKSAKDITLFEVIVIIDGESALNECVLGLKQCGDEQPCCLHQEAKKNREELKTLYRIKTIRDLSLRERKGECVGVVLS
ncbi:MAG: Rrf2 family transcriptional regulator [SAR324 cluster bacterium]|nr:Rrf2 family transcriptional regulator [SAR324 cluster bacterium]